MTKVYVVFFRDAHKSYSSEILGVYLSRDDAIDALVDYLNDCHRPSSCYVKNNGEQCEYCEKYYSLIDSIDADGSAGVEYEIYEMEMGKNWY